MIYRGRFAPTASGPLHAGSLLCALASWLAARVAGGQWFLRIDDLDEARCRPVHATTIQAQLEAHGLTWDGRVRFQSRHQAEYHGALTRLMDAGQLYACRCTRAVLTQTSLRGPDGPVYRGDCRLASIPAPADATALRVKVNERTLVIEDRCQGRIEREAARDIGDFLVRRSDGRMAYQLASVIDEAALGITEIVRGSDLIGSSFRQLVLREKLGLTALGHCHIPLLVGPSGDKLSKQNHARPIEIAMAASNLFTALQRLGQAPPQDLQQSDSVAECLGWALGHWRADRLPRATRLPTLS